MSRVALALVCLYFIWGSTYLAIRWGVVAFPPFELAALRYLIAGVALYALLRVTGAPRPSRRELLGAAPTGVLLLTLGNGVVVYVEQWVSSGVAAVAIASVPLWTALFSGVLGQWPRPREWAGLALGAAGVALLSSRGDLQSDSRSALLLLMAAASWALGSVVSRRLPRAPGLMSSALQMICGGVALAGVSVALGERLTAPHQLRPLLALAYLVVFGSMIAFSAYSFLLRSVPPALATSYAFVNPGVALCLGSFLGGEAVAWTAIASMALILAGVALVSFRRTPPGRAVVSGTS